MAKTEKDTNAGVVKRRKQIKESAAEQLIMDNIPMGAKEADDSSVSDSTEQSQAPKFLQNLHLLLNSSFCPIDTIAIATSTRPTFASLLIDVFSFRSSLF